MQRLVKGAGSNQGAARQGFSAAMACLLQAAPELSTADVLATVDQWLAVTGSMKPSEQKNIQLGQLFMYGACVQAGRATSADSAASVVTALLTLASKRPFMAEACVAIVLDVCDALDSSAISALVRDCEALATLLQSPADSASPEAVQAALHLWPHLEQVTVKRCPLLPRGVCPSATLFARSSSDSGRTAADDAAAAALFSAKHLPQLEEAARRSSCATPRLHGMWQHLLRLLLPGFQMRNGSAASPGTPPDEGEKAVAGYAGAGQLTALWTHLVEGALMTSSHERKAVGLQLFCVLLPHLRAADVPFVFRGNFMRTVANHLKDKDRYLHKRAANCIDRLVDWAESSQTGGGGGAPSTHSLIHWACRLCETHTPAQRYWCCDLELACVPCNILRALTAHLLSCQTLIAHADTRAAVLFALSTYAKAGFDGVTKSKAVNRLSASLDGPALEAYAGELMDAFASGALRFDDGSDSAAHASGANGAAAAPINGASAADAPVSAEVAAAVASVQLWALGQLGLLVKMKRCSVALAQRVVLFMAAVAFVDVGAKAAHAKAPAVRQLAACTSGWSDEVRAFATSRTFVLATDVLPCMAPAAAVASADADGNAAVKQINGAVKPMGSPLLPEVRRCVRDDRTPALACRQMSC